MAKTKRTEKDLLREPTKMIYLHCYVCASYTSKMSRAHVDYGRQTARKNGSGKTRLRPESSFRPFFFVLFQKKIKKYFADIKIVYIFAVSIKTNRPAGLPEQKN